MRKSIVIALCAVAAAACTKAPINAPEPAREFTIEALAPSFETTKISLGELASNNVPINWSAGDKFALFLLPPENEADYAAEGKKGVSVTNSSCTYAGEFTTTSTGKTGLFTGTIPAENVGTTQGIAFFPADIVPENKRNSNNKFTFSSGATRFGIGLHVIPSTQDGTGVKYLYAAARLKDGVLGAFSYYVAMIHFNIPEAAKVTRIVASTDSSTGLAGEGTGGGYNTAWNLSSDKIIMGNVLDPEVTVTNGGILSGDVYIVIRGVNKDSYLQFDFTYDGGKKKTYKHTLTANISNGNFIDYGMVFPGSTKVEYKVKDAEYTPTRTEDPTFFPYKNGNYYGFGQTDATAADLAAAEKNAGEIEWTINGESWSTYTTSTTKPYYFTTNAVATQYMQIGQGGVLGFPKIEGKKLVKVILNVNNAEGNKKSIKITSDKEGNNVVSGGDAQYNYSTITTTYDLSGTEENTRYYLKDVTGNVQPKTITLFYQDI